MLYLAGGLVLGETMALWMTVEQEVFGLAAVLLGFSCAFVWKFMRGRGGGKRGRPAFFVRVPWMDRRFWGWALRQSMVGEVTVLMILTVLAGCVVGVWRMEREQRVIRREEALVAECAEAGGAVWMEGVVEEIGKTEYGSRLIMKNCGIIWEYGSGNPPKETAAVVVLESAGIMNSVYTKEEAYSEKLRKLYVYVDSDEGIRLGMRVRVPGELSLSEPERNPGQFDFRSYCLAKGICGSLKGDSVEIVDSRYLLVQEWLRQVGLSLERRLEIIADKEDVGLLKAILLGEKGDMDNDVYQLYQKNGISHVLAISGLHVSVIGMGLWNGLRKAGAGYWSAGVCAFGMLFCFGSIAGFGSSVVRAVFMMGLSFLAGAFGRTYDLPSAMAVPGMGLILWKPYVLTQASFQLSFLAVFAIFFPGAYLSKRWKLKGACQNVWTSVSIQLVTLPAVLYHSFEIPVYSILLNLVVVPLMTYVLVSGILGLAGSFVWVPLGTFLLGGAHYILAFYKMACGLVETVTGAYLVLGRPEFWEIAVYYGCLFGGTVLAVRWRFALLWLLGVLVLVPRPPHGLEVTFLDVGQGDGIFVKSGAGTILVDCGSSQEKTLGEDLLVPFLKSQGVDCIDTVIVTHGDQDHISGIRYLLEDSSCGIEVGRLVMPVTGIGDDACEELKRLAQIREIPVYAASAEGMWDENGAVEVRSDVSITCLHPSGRVSAGGERSELEAAGTGVDPGDRNSGSLVLKLEYGAFHMVLTGDVEAEGEKRMVARGFSGPVTVLKAAHHGSASSTTQEFLDAAEPEYVILSYGSGNRYGHPADEVVERCLDAGAKIWETAKSGAIQIRTDGKIMQIRGWLDRREGI